MGISPEPPVPVMLNAGLFVLSETSLHPPGTRHQSGVLMKPFHPQWGQMVLPSPSGHLSVETGQEIAIST